MKRKVVICYFIMCIVIFVGSIFFNQDYFYNIAYDNLVGYQMKQVLSVLLLFLIGYFFLKALQQNFNDRWVVLLSMPCGAAMWVFAGQALMLTNITYTMTRTLVVLGILIVLCFVLRSMKKVPLQGSLFPNIDAVLIVVGTAFIVSTGLNYINMNYDSYLYFADYGKMMALTGDYQAWNSENAFVITNIGQFLPTLNSYSAFWGIEYCLSIQSFLVLNMYAIFAEAVYERSVELADKKNRIGYTILFTAALMSCTCVLVFSNWMLSNAFIMYYITIMGIIGLRAPTKIGMDYAAVVIGSSLAITLLRKDGIVLVCFVLICYCCNRVAKPRLLALYLLVPSIIQLYYIGYIRFYLKTQVHTALGTSLLSNKFVLLTIVVILAAFFYLLVIHQLFEKNFGSNIYIVILAITALMVIVAITLKPEASYNHVDAILKVLTSPAYGFSILTWFVLAAIMLTGKVKPDYEMLLVIGYCMLTFLIYWNKGNTEQGIDNSGMRTFVQIVPMLFFWASGYIKQRWKRQENNLV